MIMKVYKMAVCLYPDIAGLDMNGPLEFLATFSTEARKKYQNMELVKDIMFFPDGVAINPTFLSHTLDPVCAMTGVRILPDATYADSKDQFDIILIPGGAGALPQLVHADTVEFIKRQGPGAKYVLSVCNGGWLLAITGLLDGKKATTNKFGFNIIVEATKKHNITWVPKARWVVDDDKPGDRKYWTSSGVTAGQQLHVPVNVSADE